MMNRRLDSRLSRAHLGFLRYLHAMSMGVIAAFDMYLECSEGLLDAAWMVAKKDRMSFSQFRLRLSEQMLLYDPRNDLYAGDKKITVRF